ncbi:MAG: DNA polymerase [Microcystis panniformis Mp_MB_F_20051200_S9]|uniref:DNA polymerase n=1 Tax=Microcystis panniformis Mp_MB_F_20051200_S9 TaxID=2486223 RepID=A0A552Q108_9CHRO|nr:MAG: DNA polymerase [Microcystis panniformis Mp_GB_SS_20050300_S99]TRV46879.1 MAG: DNA polymerase [Microcystis panniformis Mp_GB_SS_20050300_S99D]TRV52395.1 MAG: DNA polymerase [Microcystis panniformis Mp_MB_F_20080800_S26D]TRV61827.1 MAG: DNA polymerase [Microcystis panniformis Mp_MB_F_20080800_S26]TRV62884.1 MAG: DNA polymerase [Microcystis panniformis Mp_MB_F_20051200_S9]TRV64579.1 MAG: DNA polymerase [Microcystis panniformis Mp_MB_F_20051200_S9D]TRV69868.1 MAG: DNA polymerase [Microcys
MTLQDVMELAKQLSPMDKKRLIEQLLSELELKEVKPKTLEEIKAILIPYKPFLVEKFKIWELGIFGSYVRGEQNKDSDVDILVEFSQVPTLFDLVEIEYSISDKLGLPVDLVDKKSLKAALRENILNETVYL